MSVCLRHCQSIVLIAEYKGGLRGEMSEYFIKESADYAERKQFLFILLVRHSPCIVQNAGIRMGGTQKRMA